MKSLRDKTSSERKGEPIHAGVLMYFPDALAAVARVSKVGNDKHNPGEPLHWSRGKSNDHLDCVARHIITPTEIDDDSKEYHLAHAAWRVLAALQLLEEMRLLRTGVRPLSGENSEVSPVTLTGAGEVREDLIYEETFGKKHNP